MIRKWFKRIVCGILLAGVLCSITVFAGTKIKPFKLDPSSIEYYKGRILLDLAHLDTSLDNGASYGGYTEREIVNSISLKVRDKLVEAGYDVELTRDMNTPTSIGERVRMANEGDYDVYISLHINSCAVENTGTGVEAFSNGAWSLSNGVLRDMSAKFGLANRGVHETPYYNRNINKNNTLIELGFINNDKDRDILVYEQESISEIIVKNILENYWHGNLWRVE